MSDEPAPIPDRDVLTPAPGVTVDRALVRWRFARGGGPGGQNVNKVNTRAELWVRVTDVAGLSPAAQGRLRQFAGKRLTAADEVHIVAGEARSQEMNRQSALDRLVDLIAKAAPEPKARRRTRPSHGSKLRRLAGKRLRAETKARRRGPLD